MALAIQLAAYSPEVLVMQAPVCPRHRIPMIEVDSAQGCYRCEIDGCDQTADLPPRDDAGQAPPDGGGGPARRPAVDSFGPSPLMDRALPVTPVHWLAHIGIRWPLYPVTQSNARDDYSIMNGPAAPGGGSKSSGRKRKKGKGGQKFTDSPWGSEGGTNSK